MALYYPLPTWKPSTLTAYKDAVVADAPIGYWQLGESSMGDTAIDVMSTYNGVYWTNNTNLVFNIDGINNVAGNTAIEFPSGSSAGMKLSTPSWSIGAEASYEAWIKTSDISDDRRRIISIQEGGVGAYVFMAIETQLLEYGDSGYGIAVKGVTSLCDNAWHHIVITKKDDDKIYWYVDGSSLDNAPIGTGCSSVNEEPNFGRTSNSVEIIHGAIEGFSGIIDEVAIYDYALNLTQIQNHYNLGKY